ncbi:MAG: hypothetical protein ABW072_07675 [Sedimenticola sp.]
MALYRLSDTQIEALDETDFFREGLKEREDLQRYLRDRVEVVAPGTMVIAEEYGQWEESRRRIDLLAIDKNANLVVIELKRTKDGGHMELQAIRYAAMVSKMTFEQAVRAHSAYLQQRHIEGDAKSRILDFLGWEDEDENDFAQEVRLVLVSAEFSKELTTAVMWLLERDLDIRCVRLKPYSLEGTVLINAEQVIPLPEAEDYQVKVREKVREERERRQQTKDLTKYDVTVDGQMLAKLPKRRAIFHIVKALTGKGVSVQEITELLAWRGSGLWRIVSGEVDSEEFAVEATAAAENGGLAFDPRRWFYADEQLISDSGSTYALTKMWGERTEEGMTLLVDKFGQRGVSFSKSD